MYNPFTKYKAAKRVRLLNEPAAECLDKMNVHKIIHLICRSEDISKTQKYVADNNMQVLNYKYRDAYFDVVNDVTFLLQSDKFRELQRGENVPIFKLEGDELIKVKHTDRAIYEELLKFKEEEREVRIKLLNAKTEWYKLEKESKNLKDENKRLSIIKNNLLKHIIKLKKQKANLGVK